MSKYVVITGGTGLIGRALVKVLAQKDYNLILLSRKKVDRIDNVEVKSIIWDSEKPSDIKHEIDVMTNGEPFALINLAGYPIAQSRWSNDIKKKILNSRVKGTEYLANEICGNDSIVTLFVSASAVGYYGDTNEEVDENSPKGEGFLSEVCSRWESAALDSKVDTKIIRIGVVLSKDGGALEKMMLPYKFFVGGPIGTGKQYVPWIHIEDLVNAIIYILENRPKGDVFNLVAPDAVDMTKFSKTLAKILRRPNLFPVPSFILKITMGEMASMILKGQKVKPGSLLNSGYKFKYTELDRAFSDIIE